MKESAAEDELCEDTFLVTILNVVKHTELFSVCLQENRKTEANLTIHLNTITNISTRPLKSFRTPPFYNFLLKFKQFMSSECPETVQR